MSQASIGCLTSPDIDCFGATIRHVKICVKQCTCTHTHTHIHTLTYTHTYTHTCTLTHTLHTHANTYSHTHTHRCFLVTLLDTVATATADSHVHCSKWIEVHCSCGSKLYSLCINYSFLPRLLIILGLVWVLFSMATSAVRAYTLHLLDSSIYIEWLSSVVQTQ